MRHTTKYESFSKEELENLFHASNWSTLTTDDKVEACQEIVNREALAHSQEAPEVLKADLRGVNMALFNPANGNIEINSYVLESNQIMDENGNLTPYPGGNAETLNSLYHENSHAYDHLLSQAVEDMLAGNAYNHGIIEDAQARGIDIDQVRASNTIYIPHESNPYAYRVEYSERTAFHIGDSKTEETFKGIESRLGKDAGYEQYCERLNASQGYEESMNELSKVYNDVHFDKTLDEQAKDIYFSDHTASNDFQNGTPSSRASARIMLGNTRGAAYVHYAESAGIYNEHFIAENSDAAVNNGYNELSNGLNSISGIQDTGIASNSAESVNDDLPSFTTTLDNTDAGINSAGIGGVSLESEIEFAGGSSDDYGLGGAMSSSEGSLSSMESSSASSTLSAVADASTDSGGDCDGDF